MDHGDVDDLPHLLQVLGYVALPPEELLARWVLLSSIVMFHPEITQNSLTYL